MTELSQLPPLILHPFSGGAGTDDLVNGSLASLALQGLVASTEEEAVLAPPHARRTLPGSSHAAFSGQGHLPLDAAMRGTCAGLPDPAPTMRESSSRVLPRWSWKNLPKRLGRSWKAGASPIAAPFFRAPSAFTACFEEPPPANSLSADFPEKLPPLRRPRVYLLSALAGVSGARRRGLPLRDFMPRKNTRVCCPTVGTSNRSHASLLGISTPARLPAETAPIPPAASD